MIKPTKESINYSANTPQQASSKVNKTIINATIPHNYAGQRLDQSLAQLFPNWSRSRIQQWISQNKILIDNKIVVAKQKVWGNEQISIFPTQPETNLQFSAEAIALNIIYEDDSIIIINKPTGMVVHPGNGNWQGTMLNALLHHASQLIDVPRAGIVHRLDKDTSGLLVVAKTIDAQLYLIRQLQQYQIKRHYLALVLGQVAHNGHVDQPIGRHPVQRTKMAVTQKGKPARTHYQSLEYFDGCTLLQCRLETGRTHQIRVHMHNIGHPLVGDPVYGGRTKTLSHKVGQLLTSFPRQALHAQQLALTHPESKKIMDWKAPLPEDMDSLLQTLQKISQTKNDQGRFDSV